MGKRTTRDRLKRVLSENCLRNNAASSQAIAEFFLTYKEDADKRIASGQHLITDENGEIQETSVETEEIAAMLAFILEGYEKLSEFIQQINDEI